MLYQAELLPGGGGYTRSPGALQQRPALLRRGRGQGKGPAGRAGPSRVPGGCAGLELLPVLVEGLGGAVAGTGGGGLADHLVLLVVHRVARSRGAPVTAAVAATVAVSAGWSGWT